MTERRKPSLILPAIGAGSLAALLVLSVAANYGDYKTPRPRSQKPYVPSNIPARPPDLAKGAANRRIAKLIEEAIESVRAEQQKRITDTAP